MLRAMLLLSIVLSWPPALDEAWAADTANGERLFRACSGCHSMEPGRHLTGPSLAGVFGHRAGTAEGFRRYSDALKSADLIWTEDTLDAWLADPKRLVPGNLMTFPGIDDPEARRDLIAFIQAAQSGAPQGSGQGEGGMMGGPALDDLENLPPENQVDAITYCGDTYRVTTRAGQTIPFWEFNLRFKTDSSDRGPSKGTPALLRASMMGDRAFVIFADPAEISSFVQPQC